jgi:hypothetical protein
MGLLTKLGVMPSKEERRAAMNREHAMWRMNNPEKIGAVVSSVSGVIELAPEPEPEPEPIFVSAEQIHQEILTVSNSILTKKVAEIEELESRMKMDKYELQVLRDHGFVSVPSVVENREIESEVLSRQAIVEALQHYRDLYPQNPFVSSDDLQKIMEKYDLVMGWPEIFKSDIPEKNRAEIAAFKVHESTKTTETQRGYLTTKPFTVIYDNHYGSSKEVYTTANYHSIVVVGKQADFDMEKRFIDRSRQISEKHEAYYPPRPKFDARDPIVLQSVRYGYLVVTAWGEEAKLIDNSGRN